MMKINCSSSRLIKEGCMIYLHVPSRFGMRQFWGFCRLPGIGCRCHMHLVRVSMSMAKVTCVGAET